MIIKEHRNPISFSVTGEPVPKQSFIYTGRKVSNSGKVSMGYTPQKAKNWQEFVNTMARNAIALQDHPGFFNDEDLVCYIEFFLSGKPRKDDDNLAKPVLDAMNKVVYKDDAQIIETYLMKHNNCSGVGAVIYVAQLENQSWLISEGKIQFFQ